LSISGTIFSRFNPGQPFQFVLNLFLLDRHGAKDQLAQFFFTETRCINCFYSELPVPIAYRGTDENASYWRYESSRGIKSS